MNKTLQLLGLAKKAGKVEAGEAPAGAAARMGSGRLLLLASDAAENTCRRAGQFAQMGNMPLFHLPLDKSQLGGAIGRSSCAIVVLTDLGFAASLAKKLAQEYGDPYIDAAASLSQAAARKQQRRKTKGAVKQKQQSSMDKKAD